MSKNRLFHGKPTTRLIVSVETATVERIDQLMNRGACHGHRNRAEFVRQAIERELARCRNDDSWSP